MSLSLSSIIWHRPKRGDAVRTRMLVLSMGLLLPFHLPARWRDQVTPVDRLV